MQRVPFLEAGTSARFPQPNYNTLPSPRIVKTHLPYNIVPKSANEDNKCKYIYIARNPKDVAVSRFKFTTSLKVFGNGFNGPWEFYTKLFVEGNGKWEIPLGITVTGFEFIILFLFYTVGWNSWNDHVLGWWKHKDDPNILFLKYEDLQKVCYMRPVFSWPAAG